MNMEDRLKRLLFVVTPEEMRVPAATRCCRSASNSDKIVRQLEKDREPKAQMCPVNIRGADFVESNRPEHLPFHSLRHTATTLLKSAGVSDAVAREFIGHDSPTV
jgi:integrase